MIKINSGAEANIYLLDNKIVKERISKNYRDPTLDKKIIKTRNKKEKTLLEKVKALGLNVPTIYSVSDNSITMERIEDTKTHKEQLKEIGKNIAILHNNDIIHGDLNLINILITKKKEIYFIDFGLGYSSRKKEDKATDLLVFKKTLLAQKKTEKYWEEILEGYKKETNQPNIIEQIEKIEKRARYL